MIQHLETGAHKRHVELHEATSKRQKKLTEFGVNGKDVFNQELCEAALAANIPLRKICHPAMKQFLEKHTNHTVANRRALSEKHIDSCYERVRKFYCYKKGIILFIAYVQPQLALKHLFCNLGHERDSFRNRTTLLLRSC